MKKLKIILLGLTLFTFSCSKSEKSEQTENNTTQTDVAADTAAVSIYTVKGVVSSLPPGGKFIIINHEKIPGFMNAMKMPFYLESPDVAKNISPKDSIKFTFEAKSGKMTITDIAKLK